MTNEEYLEKLNSVAFGRSFEPGFLETWFAESLKILEILAQQSKQIDHPRHRGDSREDSFQKFLRSILSPNHLIIKGFAVDKYASMSKEQDNLICRSDLFTPLANTDSISYIPIDSVVGSIEIKSNLTLDELRKCVINCASLKSINYPYNPAGIYPSEKDNIIYSVFAYGSDKTAKQISELLPELSKTIPQSMWINQIYILNQELIMPCRKDGTIILGPRCDISGEYEVVNEINFYNNENDKIFPFLWFLSNIIDNISKHAQNKKPMDSFSYFFQPALFQHQMREKVFGKKESTQEKDY